MLYPARFVSCEPSLFWVGAFHDKAAVAVTGVVDPVVPVPPEPVLGAVSLAVARELTATSLPPHPARASEARAGSAQTALISLKLCSPLNPDDGTSKPVFQADTTSANCMPLYTSCF